MLSILCLQLLFGSAMCLKVVIRALYIHSEIHVEYKQKEVEVLAEPHYLSFGSHCEETSRHTMPKATLIRDNV